MRQNFFQKTNNYERNKTARIGLEIKKKEENNFDYLIASEVF